MFNTQNGLAMAYFLAGRNEDASSWAAAATRQQPKFVAGQYVLAACHVMSGRVDQAREACAHAMQLDPNLRISGILARYRRPDHIERWAQAFRIVSIPE
ncbi:MULTISPECIES: tetratricopeptide repeat protein [unclassified Bradyrhizobium]|uniref:tetratricopeptide repeat protein n=1 Tax=unclassified Bradyrhizobium TaxID=2631580 RepID=UPI001BA94FE4|nr:MULTISPECIES: tetratricopeptide repeat protein [unclassified Bradyrhizobium]MBR1226605.1 tetratricopeptide repeat protein [Bradyrhizobium sp. AUGA SZCCT0176]MBR1297030.1 tetratricopeptide repeat protein [Bradyrhizobium sp. AUGA SZCCT0042]